MMGEYLLAAVAMALYLVLLAAIIAWLVMLPTIGLIWSVGWLA